VNTSCSHPHSFCATGASSGLPTRVTLIRVFVVYLMTLFSNWDYTASYVRVMSDELEIMWKEAVVSSVISRYYAWIDWEKQRHLCQDSWSLGRDLNPGPPEYKAGILTIQPRRWHWFECHVGDGRVNYTRVDLLVVYLITFFSNWDYTAPYERVISDELQTISKEAVVA
jgi:hypothetical protein